VTGEGTLARELGALDAAAREHRRAAKRLLLLDRDSAAGVEAPGVTVQPAYEWLLGGGGET
jgi:hypothetical protein